MTAEPCVLSINSCVHPDSSKYRFFYSGKEMQATLGETGLISMLLKFANGGLLYERQNGFGGGRRYRELGEVAAGID